MPTASRESHVEDTVQRLKNSALRIRCQLLQGSRIFKMLCNSPDKEAGAGGDRVLVAVEVEVAIAMKLA
ncbi:MAG: hypothetical protein AB1861_18315 [Cyanobacteriota bacterium]